jgi:hypothetical protein
MKSPAKGKAQRKGKIGLSMSYGYDVHRIEIDEKTFAAIRSGQRIEQDGQGFMHEEEGKVADHWVFNDPPGEIYFCLDNGAQYFAQKWWIEEN